MPAHTHTHRQTWKERVRESDVRRETEPPTALMTTTTCTLRVRWMGVISRYWNLKKKTRGHALRPIIPWTWNGWSTSIRTPDSNQPDAHRRSTSTHTNAQQTEPKTGSISRNIHCAMESWEIPVVGFAWMETSIHGCCQICYKCKHSSSPTFGRRRQRIICGVLFDTRSIHSPKQPRSTASESQEYSINGENKRGARTLNVGFSSLPLPLAACWQLTIASHE